MVVEKTFQYGKHTVTMKTGNIANQATSAVWLDMDDTIVLATVVAKETADPNANFFPLSVHFQERAYAAGKIPGGYFKREGRPAEREILISRLIDRPIRPLFPEEFNNEIQVVVMLMSLNPEVSADIPAIIAASAALSIAGVPFQGPVAAAKIGYKDGRYLLNPTQKELQSSALNLVVAGTENAVLMVESEADALSEEVMLGAVMYGHEQMQAVIQAICAFKNDVDGGSSSWSWQPAERNIQLSQQIQEFIHQDLTQAYQIADKALRNQKLRELHARVSEQFVSAELSTTIVNQYFEECQSSVVRQRVLDGLPRIDGRDRETVRPIKIETGVLPRVHGSSTFTRGETQVITAVTLGTDRDVQMIDALEGETKDRFMLHYNFPPFCVGETGMMSGPKRREIGHGHLAKRAIQAVLPKETDLFPYVIRIVAEVLSSNGSSSMATVCGSSLALMDAGVPIKAPVAGIAMGLVKQGEKYAILTDILGDEDHLGDMDFKVAGTETGITALQMDIKIDGITEEVMAAALKQAKTARLHILNEMQKTLSAAREKISSYAPRIITMEINPQKIRDVIGKGGATIRAIIDETGANINIEDTGVVTISSSDEEAGLKARAQIEKLTADVEVGAIYEGKVVKIMEFGAFVNLLPGKDGFLHISQISGNRIEDISKEISEGQVVKAKVLEIDKQGRVRLTLLDV